MKTSSNRCLCSVALFATLATAQIRADSASDLQGYLTTLQKDLRHLQVIVAAPPDSAPILLKYGVDLSSLGAYLIRIEADLTNSTTLTQDLQSFHSAVTAFDTEVQNSHPGTTNAEVDFVVMGRNFKDVTAELDKIITTDLKSGNMIATVTSALKTHLDILARDLEALGPGLPTVAKAKIPELTTHGTNNSWGTLFFWAGARLENPYSITTAPSNTTGTLKSNNKTTDGFIDFNVDLRYIFRTGKYEDGYWLGDPANHKSDGLNRFWPLMLQPDINCNFGYVFTGSSAPSNYSTSTIAGGGDLSLNTTVGFPFLRYKPTDPHDTNSLKMQITFPEIGGGMSTDKSFLLVHPNLFLGAGFQLAAPAKDFYWSGELGYALVDEPKITSGSSVALDGFGNPQFGLKGALTMGSTIIYRITDSLSAQLGGSVYLTKVGSWTLFAAVSIDPTKFFQSLK